MSVVVNRQLLQDCSMCLHDVPALLLILAHVAVSLLLSS